MSGDATRYVPAAGGRLDPVRRELQRADEVISLTPKECDLLAFLAERSGEVVSRDTLHREVWEYAPGVVSRAADFTVHRLRQKIEPDPGEPSFVITEPGEGYRYQAGGAPGERPVSLTNLPPALDGWVGRAEELARLRELLEGDARLVTITGPGGVGKTRLAAELIRSLEPPEGGAWLCSLADARTLEDVVATVVEVLDLSPGAAGAAVDVVGAALGGRGETLLVLDNVEQVAGAVAPAVGAWLQAAPAVRIVVTSRRRVGLSGEAVVELGPLSPEDAVALFVERAERLRPGVGFDEGTLRDVRALVDQLDRLPLGIELAAGRIDVLSPAELQARLGRHLGVLRSRRSDAPARHATLQAAVDWSWQLLEPFEQRALAWCAVFVGGFTLASAEAVLAGRPGDALEALTALRERSLLAATRPEGPRGPPRFAPFETVRVYAVEQLERRRERAQAEAAHAEHVVALGQRLAEAVRAPTAEQAARQIERLAQEVPNLLAVRERFLDRDPILAARAVRAALPVLTRRRSPRSVIDLVEPLLGVAEPDLAVDLAQQVVRFRCMVGDLREAEHALASSEALLHDLRDPGRRARWLLARATLERGRGRLDDSARSARQAIEVAEEHGNEWLRSMALLMHGVTAHLRGHTQRAEPRYRDAVASGRSAGHWHVVGSALGDLGVLLSDTLAYPDAEASHRAALEVHRGLGDRRMESVALLNLGTVAAATGRQQQAAERYEEAASVSREVGYVTGQGRALINLASCRQDVGEPGAAVELAGRARALLEEARDRDALVRLDALEAAARAELGQVRSARALIERARPGAEERGDAVGLAVLRLAEGHVRLAEGAGAGSVQAVLEESERLAEQNWGVRSARERLRRRLAADR